MSASDEAKWYVLQTYSGYEDKVSSNIMIVAKTHGLDSFISEIKVPREEVTEIKNGKQETKMRKTYPGYVFIKLVLTIEIHDLQEDVSCSTQLFGCPLFAGHRHAYDVVGTHLFGDVGRIIIAQSTIHKHLFAFSHGGESPRNRHTRPHGLTEYATMENNLAVVNHVGCDTGKSYGEGVEIDRISVGISEGSQKLADILTDDEAATNRLFLFLQPQTGRKGIGVVLLTLFQTLVFQVVPVRQHN